MIEFAQYFSKSDVARKCVCLNFSKFAKYFKSSITGNEIWLPWLLYCLYRDKGNKTHRTELTLVSKTSQNY